MRKLRILRLLVPVVLIAPAGLLIAAPAQAATANPAQACAVVGLAGDDVSGRDEGDHTVYVDDPATLVVTNTNVLPEVVTFTPEGEKPQTATLATWNVGHTFHFPAPGSLQTPYAHSFGLKVNGVPYTDSTSAQLVAVVKSNLCGYQRRITATQVAGTGVAPVTGTGTLKFTVHLSADAPPVVKAVNPDPFVINYLQEAQGGTADLANGIHGSVTVTPGQRDATITVPVAARPAGSAPTSMWFRLSGNDKHVPTPILFTGTVTSPAKPVVPPPVATAPRAPVLAAGTRSTSSIALSWAAVSGATRYTVYEDSAVRCTVSAPATGCTVTGLGSNTTHTFTATASNAAGESPRSNAVTVATMPTYRYAFVSQAATNPDGSAADLAHARPGQRFTVTVSVRNTGTATWASTGAAPVLLGTYRPADRGSALAAPGWVSSTRPARLGQSSVPPGGTGTFTFPIVAPGAAGTVTEYFNLVAEGASWFTDAGLSVAVTTVDVRGLAIVPGTGLGQWVVAADGGVFAFAGAPFYGSMAGRALNRPITGMAPTPSGHGYWLVGADGGVFAYGDAAFSGSMAGKPLNAAVVGIAATPSGRGYWLAGADGGVFAYGDAVFSGSMAGKALNGPVVSITATADGRGYWLAGADGGVFAFGTAPFGGSRGAGAAPAVVGLARTGPGYALVDRTGQVTAFSTGGPAPRSVLYPGERLNPGERLTSANGRYGLVMQGDGNLVEVDAGRPVWASGTNGHPGSDLEAQTDGNFVIYAAGHVAVWSSRTSGRAGSVLRVQDDRNVVIYAPGNVAVWASGSGA